MASITIQDLDDDVEARLRIRAADHGLSVEEEVHRILREAVEGRRHAAPVDLAAAIRSRFTPLGGVELELPPREQYMIAYYNRIFIGGTEAYTVE